MNKYHEPPSKGCPSEVCGGDLEIARSGSSCSTGRSQRLVGFRVEGLGFRVYF